MLWKKPLVGKNYPQTDDKKAAQKELNRDSSVRKRNLFDYNKHYEEILTKNSKYKNQVLWAPIVFYLQKTESKFSSIVCFVILGLPKKAITLFVSKGCAKKGFYSLLPLWKAKTMAQVHFFKSVAPAPKFL